MHSRTFPTTFLFLLVVMPIAMISTGETVSTQTCNIHTIGYAIGAAGNPASPQSIEAFAEQSSQYSAAVAGSNSTYMEFANNWSINESHCTVSWTSATANFLVQDSSGAKHVLVVDENPVLGIIYNVTSEPYLIAAISPNTQSPTYAGYEIANSSSASVAVTYAEADWTVPSVSLPTGSPGDPSCDNIEPYDQCIVADWVGIQNSTYNGNYFPTGVGEVLQTGTFANYTCASSGSPCFSSEVPFLGYYRASVQYSNDNLARVGFCTFGGNSGGIGDSITGEVGTDQQVVGSGSNYATVLVDWSYGTGDACSNTDYPAGTEVHTEYYADYMAERPGYYGYPTALPDFATTDFSDLEMGTGTSQQLNPYYNYNNGWGSGMYMYNDATRLTTTSSMASVGGDFSETWDNSIDT